MKFEIGQMVWFSENTYPDEINEKTLLFVGYIQAITIDHLGIRYMVMLPGSIFRSFLECQLNAVRILDREG